MKQHTTVGEDIILPESRAPIAVILRERSERRIFPRNAEHFPLLLPVLPGGERILRQKAQDDRNKKSGERNK